MFFSAAPTVTMQQSEIIVNISDHVTLSCTYTGAIPDVTSVKWYKEVNGVVSEIVTSPSTPSLTITSVVMADAGHYTCSATNAVGQRNSSSTVELKVNQGKLIMFAKSIQACLIDKSIRLSRQVPLVDQELLTLPKHMCSPPVFNITRSLVLCVCLVDGCPFWSTACDYCVVCSSSIYGF